MQVSSCKKADIQFGEEFVTDNEMQVFRVDSFSANISTVYQDSFVTSARGNIMLGGYNDPLFGQIKTQSYFEVAPPVWADIYQNTIFDSISLILKTNSIYYGDTTKPVTVIVKELQDSIVFPENKYAFYNISKFTAKPGILGSFTGLVTPLSNQTISIKLPFNLGNDLLNMLKSVNNNPIKSNTTFLNYFRGFQLSTDATTAMVVNCSDDVVMRLYYRQDGFPSATNKHVDFSLANRTHQFNNISINHTGYLSSISSSNRELPSSATNHQAYTQSTTGSLVKISFPSLRDIPKLANFAKLLKATLIVKPVKGTYNTVHSLPPTLRLSQTDINNTIGNDLAYITSSGSLAVQLGFLQIDNLANEKTQYQYDLTQYVRNILLTTPTPGEGLLLSPPSPNFEDQFARVIIGDKSNLLGNIQLQIYYATVK